MKRRISLTQRLMRHMEQQTESGTLQPILELCGDRRIWVENHNGVLEYSLERIGISVRYGSLVIHGTELCLRRMQGQMLVITGSIERIELVKGRI